MKNLIANVETLNFTQFCKKNNLPSDYDTLFEAQLLGGRGLDGKISKKAIKTQDDKFLEMQKKNKEAHELFYNAVKKGDIIDASGKLEKEEIIKKEADFHNIKIENEIKNLQSYIDLVKSMKTSYLKNGKLKKGYQLAVNDHELKIANLKSKL